jgi:deoxyinosine 3'endonuclease (endonuclease V)
VQDFINFISPGHRIFLPSVVQLILKFSQGFRLPEPTRQAGKSVNLSKIFINENKNKK